MTYEITDQPLRGVQARPGDGHYGVFDHGAQVWAYTPPGADPVLWLSQRSAFADDEPIRGGAPICFPWFASGPSGDRTPSHGYARLHTWHLSDIKDTLDRDGRLIVEYSLDHSMVADPHPYRAYLRAKFTPEYLGLAMEITNDGDEPFTYENALHTYLAVSDVRAITLSGLQQQPYFDKVSGSDGVHAGELRFTGDTDLVFTTFDDVVVDDPGFGRRLVVTKSGSANTVIWNPGDKGLEVADIGDEWSRFVCVEAANVGAGAITLLPGQTHLMKQRITLA